MYRIGPHQLIISLLTLYYIKGKRDNKNNCGEEDDIDRGSSINHSELSHDESRNLALFLVHMIKVIVPV